MLRITKSALIRSDAESKSAQKVSLFLSKDINGIGKSSSTNTDLNHSPKLGSKEKKFHLQFHEHEKFLHNFNSSASSFEDVTQEIQKLYNVIDLLYESSLNLLKLNIRAYTSLNIDQRLWKVSVYDYVTLSRQSSKKLNKEAISSTLSTFLEKCCTHFQELLSEIEHNYPFTTNPSTGHAEYNSTSNLLTNKFYKNALVLYPRILVSLGDTKRYFSSDSDNLRKAMEFYEKARSFDPTQGRVFHQMGVVTLIRKDMISSAYNFVRAHFCGSPAEGAKQQLLIVFDEAFKMYLKNSGNYWSSTVKKTENLTSAKQCRQIWTLKSYEETDCAKNVHFYSKEGHLKNLSSVEIFKRFSLTYVQVIGKLYTGIGLESLNTVAEESLIYLEGLLNKKEGPSQLLPLRLIQIITLNMFSISSVSKNDTLLLLSLQYAFEIFSLFILKLCKLIDLCDWDNNLMESLSVGIVTWIEWMRLYPKLWTKRRPRPYFSPQFSTSPKSENSKDRTDYVWENFSELLSKLETIFKRYQNMIFPSVSQNEDSAHSTPLSPLPECKNLYGFPLFQNAQVLSLKYFCDSKRLKMRGRNLVRLQNIYQFGTEVLVQKYQILSQTEENEIKIENNVLNYKNNIKVKRSPIEEVGGLDQSHLLFWIINSEQSSSSHSKISSKIPLNPDANNSRIIIRQNASHAKKPENSKVVDIYSKWQFLTNKGFPTQVIIQPERLVLDTNCYLEKISHIKVLLSLISQPIYVPVSVILELKGLSKGGMSRKDKLKFGEDVRSSEAQERMIDRNEIASLAKEVLNFISENMRYFKIVTSSGRGLKVKKPSDFITDESHEGGGGMKNDDRILECCKNLEENDKESRSKDTEFSILRKTVLVTGDRYLRIKTFAVDIPSRPLGSIIYWLILHRYPHLKGEMRKYPQERQHRSKNYAKKPIV